MCVYYPRKEVVNDYEDWSRNEEDEEDLANLNVHELTVLKVRHFQTEIA